MHQTGIFVEDTGSDYVTIGLINVLFYQLANRLSLANTWAYHLSSKLSIAVKSVAFNTLRSTLSKWHFQTCFRDKNPDNKSALVLVMAWCRPGNNHYLHQWWPSSLRHMYITWSHWVKGHNSLPDSKVHGANMGPTLVLSVPDGPHVGPMNLAIRASLFVATNQFWPVNPPMPSETSPSISGIMVPHLRGTQWRHDTEQCLVILNNLKKSIRTDTFLRWNFHFSLWFLAIELIFQNGVNIRYISMD